MPEAGSVTPAELPDLLHHGWQLLDVRTDEEWANGRIAGAAHVPLDQLVDRLPEVAGQVVCVCASGRRSGQAAAYLAGQGRTAVNLDGGLHAWVDEGRPLEA